MVKCIILNDFYISVNYLRKSVNRDIRYLSYLRGLIMVLSLDFPRIDSCGHFLALESLEQLHLGVIIHNLYPGYIMLYPF